MLVVIYALMINILTYMVMKMDKDYAIKGDWRVPEKILWILSVLGGFIGFIIAMKVYRHKILKPKF
ncbi:DUF1294 domain-containing protein [Helicobacter cetorum]|uniref:DUF1294 domain-containing protein n=1 Tax=Helicobacter cetorum TaxID=138563 RepID=UPI000CF01F1C|nr:DUF1294 domain-containing protein [Helicobacter cetorum]